MELNKQKVQILKLRDAVTTEDEYVAGTPAFRFGIVWDLTLDVLAFQRDFDAESRLQRHVVRLIRQ